MSGLRAASNRVPNASDRPVVQSESPHLGDIRLDTGLALPAVRVPMNTADAPAVIKKRKKQTRRESRRLVCFYVFQQALEIPSDDPGKRKAQYPSTLTRIGEHLYFGPGGNSHGGMPTSCKFPPICFSLFGLGGNHAAARPASHGFSLLARGKPCGG